MSFDNTDELFEGIQIMSPSELNSAIAEQGSGEPSDNTGGVTKREEGELEIVPVAAESGDSEPTKKETSETSEEASPNKNEAVYKALIKTLVDEGVITSAQQEELEEMPGNLDSIKKLMNETIEQSTKAKQDAWKNSLSPEKKRFLEIEDAFDKTDHAIIMAQRLEFFDNLSQDVISKDETLQKQLLFEQLTSLKNFTKEEALEAVEEAATTGKLAEKAMKAAPDLKQHANVVVEEAKQLKEQRTKEEVEAQTKAFEQLLSHIDAKEHFIEGLNLNKIAKEKLKSNIVNPVYKDPKTGREYNSLMYKQMKNPAEFEMILNYYDTIGLLNIDKDGKFKPDISKLKSVAKTAAITELDKIISAEDQRGLGRNTSVETSEKTKNILDILEQGFAKK
jgi:hypothetical protein